MLQAKYIAVAKYTLNKYYLAKCTLTGVIIKVHFALEVLKIMTEGVSQVYIKLPSKTTLQQLNSKQTGNISFTALMVMLTNLNENVVIKYLLQANINK